MKNLIEEAVESLKELFTQRLSASDAHLQKSVKLLAYWIKDYVKMLLAEVSLPEKYRKYKRGEVVKVNFGFRIGHEEGGLHYAVVLSKFDNTKNSILTVMPLTSEKPNFNSEKIYFKNLYLGKEIMEAILLKLLVAKEQFEKETAAHISYMDNLQPTNVTKEQLFECKKRLEIMNKKRDEIANQIEKILQMKEGSIALTDQITTVSKIRIYAPRSSKDLLNGIRLKTSTMDKIDEKVKQLYIN